MRHFASTSLRGYACAAAVILAVLGFAPEAWSRDPQPVRCQQMTEALAKTLFDEWNKALQMPTEPDKVVQTYDPDAVLLPTFKNGPLVGRIAIRGYFVNTFLKENPVGRIDTRNIVRSACNMGVVAGLYTFTVDQGGRRVDKPARYTYVYVYKPEIRRWLISHHHSSGQPQKSEPK